MKVLLINSEHARIGGAHAVYLNTADLLMNANVEVVCFAQHSIKELPCSQSKYFPKANTQKNIIKYIRNRFYNRSAALCLQKLIEDEKPDIAHIHLMWGTLSPSILEVLKRNHIPVVHSVHDYAMVCSLVTLRSFSGEVCERCARGKFFESIKTKCHKGSLLRSIIATTEICSRNKRHHPVNLITHFIFVSHFCANKHCEMDSRFITAPKSILYNIPDEEVIQVAKDKSFVKYNSYYLYYGRLSYEKGVETLINVFVKRTELKLIIVGAGPLEESLKKRCIDFNASNIEFLGFKTGEELFRIVQNAKFVCVPSEWYENNPMTIIEAYSLGTPVVAARIGGIPEIVEDNRTGYLFHSGSEENLNRVLDKTVLLSSEDYNMMKSAAQLYSQQNFARDEYVKRLMDIYSQAIEENKFKV